MLKPDDPRLSRLWQDYPGFRVKAATLVGGDSDYIYSCRFCDRSHHDVVLVMVHVTKGTPPQNNNPVMCLGSGPCAEAEEALNFRKAVKRG